MQEMRVGDRVASGPNLGTVRGVERSWALISWDDGYPDAKEALTALKPAPFWIRPLIRWLRS
jgi:hypothetical protein